MLHIYLIEHRLINVAQLAKHVQICLHWADVVNGIVPPCELVLKADFLSWQKITRILAANIRRQFFFVITTAASTRCLVQNFQLICYSQRVNATSQYNDSGGSSTCSKWQNDLMVAVVKHCWLLVQGRRSCRER